MAFHVISLLNEGAYLTCDKGHLVCQYREMQEEKRIPLSDVRAIVAAHPAISYSNQAVAKLLAQDTVILHCDRHYKPVGWTVPLDRVIRGPVFEGQLGASTDLKRALWKQLALGKMRNQANTLTWLQVDHKLHALVEKPLASEANVARYYWQPYFDAIGAEYGKRERKGAASFENKALNYGYAVMATLVHRALLIYGLLPNLGIHHLHRYRSAPLVYDVMEPCRVIVDWLLAQWKVLPRVQNLPWLQMDDSTADETFKDWIRFLMEGLRQWRLKDGNRSLKWLDAPDKLAQSIAKAFETSSGENTLSHLWLPSILDTYHHPEGEGEA
jgi:CRISP-associated protein Cas1